MKASEKARELFLNGYNCSQSVFASFAGRYGIDEETALKISCGLGGGVGRMREVCGAVSGAALVLGLEYGSDKNVVYEAVQRFAEEFKAKRKTVICIELLENIKTTKGTVAQERNDSFYSTRPCLAIVEEAADILENMLNNK